MTVEEKDGMNLRENQLTQAKAALRKSVAARQPEERLLRQESAALCGVLNAWQPLRRARTVAAFMPMANEPQLAPLLSLLLTEGKQVAFPRCSSLGVMQFCPVVSLRHLVRGKYGILAPRDDAQAMDLSALDVMLVPLAAADRFGGRLGKGGGFYDRVLANYQGTACGVVLAHQWVNRVSMGTLDMPLRYLADAQDVWDVTESAEGKERSNGQA